MERRGRLVLELSLDDLPIHPSIRQLFNQAGIFNIRQLVGLSREQVLAIPRMGRRTVHEIHNLLSELGLDLGMSEAEINKLPENIRMTIRY